MLDTICKAINDAGYGKEIAIALDSAASEFYENGKYVFEGKPISAEALTNRYAAWAAKYPIVSFEDPLAEDDWDGWKHLTDRLGSSARVVGDDLFVTNVERLQMGIDRHAGNAILIKLNQIGTLTETLATMELAARAGFAAMVSHRSGETEDVFIADLAVATGCGQIKTGAPSRSERVAKYNQLLRIEELLGPAATYSGTDAFRAR